MDKASPSIWLPDHEAEVSVGVTDKGEAIVYSQAVTMKLRPIAKRTGFKEGQNG